MVPAVVCLAKTVAINGLRLHARDATRTFQLVRFSGRPKMRNVEIGLQRLE
jgi:hypothetical protein